MPRARPVDAGVRDGDAAARRGRRARPSLRGDSLRVDRDRRARVPAGGGRASAERLGLRRAARRGQRHPRRVVAVVEVAASRAGRTRAAARVRRRRARSGRARRSRTPSSVARSLAAIRPLLGIRGDPLFTRVYRWERANAQHEVGHLERVAAIDRALSRTPGAVPDRQRLPRRRHSRLRRRRARHSDRVVEWLRALRQRLRVRTEVTENDEVTVTHK